MREAALRLFEAKGFDAISMDQIAAAAKVSRRTLFRLFPSKADLVWEDLSAVLIGVRVRAAKLRRSRVPLRTLVESMLLPTFAWLEQPEVAKLARRRLRLIGASPGLLAHDALEQLQQTITQAVSGTTDLVAPPELVSRSLVAVGFATMLWWAEEGGKRSPMALFESALESLSATVSK